MSEGAARRSLMSPALVAGAILFGGLAAQPAMAMDCHQLTGKVFGNARIIDTERVSAPFSIGSLATPAGNSAHVTVPFCRVTGIARPAADSEVRFEVWLPDPGTWNGRFQGIGNGGFAGNIAYSGLARAVEGGYATAATDTGHTGDSSQSSWAIGHPDKIVDLGWRALHETTVAAKAVITTYYDRPATHAYFTGCSTGGRQGLVEAQRFPSDYDGIVVGAPAYNWPRLLAFGAVQYKSLMVDPARWLSPAKLALLNTTSSKVCHAVNGLIDDPGGCTFDPAVLQCRAGRTASQCLGPSELAMARLMYGGIKNRSGSLIYPGFTPGLEQSWTIWDLGRAGQAGRDSLAYPYPTGFYGNLVHQDPGWTIAQFDLATDLPNALDNPVGTAVYAEDPDLRAFFARGGKLLHYHGWHDPAIPAESSLRYYRSVVEATGAARVRASYRLFFGTGMQHCGGGPGPNAIGGVSGVPPVRDADHDVLVALQRWVETGAAPKRIIATHYTDNDNRKPVDGQRPWCPWPEAPRYVGGDRGRADAYRCQPAIRR